MCCFSVPLPRRQELVCPLMCRYAVSGYALIFTAVYGSKYSKIKIPVDFSCMALCIAVEKVVKIIPKKQLLQIK